MNDHADVIEGPEPPVPELTALDPREEVPRALDRAVHDDILRRMRAEQPSRPVPRRRTALIAVVSAVGAAAAAVALTLILHPALVGDSSEMVAKGAGDDVQLHLDYLIQRDGEPTPRRPERGDPLVTGDGVYLRAELSEPGSLTFVVEEPGQEWSFLATGAGHRGANDLQRDGQLKVFYVTEAGSYRFAAIWSGAPPPASWRPGRGELPDAESLGQDAEVAWFEVEAQPTQPAP
jgi:hypothetical protein